MQHGRTGLEEVSKEMVTKGRPSYQLSPDTMSLRACLYLQELHVSWEALGANPWVISMMTKGYCL